MIALIDCEQPSLAIPAKGGIQSYGSPTLSEKNVKFFPKSAPRMSASVKTRAALPQCCSAAFGDDKIRYFGAGGFFNKPPTVFRGPLRVLELV